MDITISKRFSFDYDIRSYNDKTETNPIGGDFSTRGKFSDC